MKKRNYSVEYVSKKGGYNSAVDNVEYWLDDGADNDDKLILRDSETLNVVKAQYK